MTRPRTPVGTFGEISFESEGDVVRARTRYRDDDGKLRRIQATGRSRHAAERRLKATIAARVSFRSYGELSPDSSFRRLVEIWLEDLELDGGLAPSTRELYERDMRIIVLPAFEHLVLREITVSKVDRFLRSLAATRSYSMGKHARTVLSLAFGLAVRYDALIQNPVRETKRLRKPPTQAKALTTSQIEAVRRADAKGVVRADVLLAPDRADELAEIAAVLN